MPRMKDVACAGCGITIAVGAGTTKPRHCAKCREARCIENLVSLMLRSGEPYERMLSAQRKARAKARGGRGPQK